MRQHRFSIPIAPKRFTTDADWAEEDHKRDAGGKFSKMAAKVGAPEHAATDKGVTHSASGKNAWQGLSDKLKSAGFVQSSFNSKKVPVGSINVYNSTAEFAHPQHGHTAQVKYTEKLGDSTATPKATMVVTPGKPPAAPVAHAIPASAPPLHSSAPVPASALVHHHLRPDPNKYKHPNDVKWMGNRLKEADAAIAIADPAKRLEALKGLKENTSYPRFTAYKKALIKHYETDPSGPMPAEPHTNATQDDPFDIHTIKGDKIQINPSINLTLAHPPPPDWTKEPDHSSKWFEYSAQSRAKLSSTAKTIIDAYQGTAHRKLNKQLAGLEPMTPYGLNATKHIREAILANALPRDFMLRRGIHSSMEDIIGTSDPSAAVGGVFEHKGFASCSRSNGFSTTTKLHISCPKGSPGYVMKKLNTEDEVLLPNSSMFRIDKIDGSNIHCTYLGLRADVK